MLIVQLVPKDFDKSNWWKKTLFFDETTLEDKGTEYVFNVSLKKYYLTKEILNSKEAILKALTNEKLISEAMATKIITKMEVIITPKDEDINLELKLGGRPLTIKMNCHLSIAPDPKITSADPKVKPYVPPHLRNKENKNEMEEISNIDKLIPLLPIKDFLDGIKQGGIIEKLSKMNTKNHNEFNYKVHSQSQDAMEQIKIKP